MIQKEGIMQEKTVGIDDMAVFAPSIYLPIQTLATARSIEYAKLNKGLGLTEMSVADVGMDAATMAAEAVLTLIERNNLHPSSIGRIYLGTESALDGAKPTATYALEMLQSCLTPVYGPDCLLHCDVVDLTFACIGAVDAMQNSLDYVRSGKSRQAIVVASDNAKYELDSSGEYTQGAGAIAVLLKENPRLLAINSEFGVATRPVHDFFKPLRKVSKRELLSEAFERAGLTEVAVDRLMETLHEDLQQGGLWDSNEPYFMLHKDTPVFDGPYSNMCYQDRIREALNDYIFQNQIDHSEPATDNWDRLVFHLPYAFQARRMFSELFFAEAKKRGDWTNWKNELQLEEPQASDFDSDEAFTKAKQGFFRAITKTSRYKTFVKEKIEKGERFSSRMGNLYTGSIFLSLMSVLEADLEEGTNLEGSQIGFFAYGSGSKSKVFAGEIMASWKEVVSRFNTTQKLDERKVLDYQTYEALHRGTRNEPVAPRTANFSLKSIVTESGDQLGARTYSFQATKKIPSASS